MTRNQNESWLRRTVRTMLTAAVRGRGERGPEWAEAVLAEYDQTRSDAEAAGWAAGGIWFALRQRANLSHPAARVALAALALLAGALGTQRFVAGVVYVPSASMEPGLHVGGRYLLDRISVRLGGLRYGDRVVIGGWALHSQDAPRSRYVLRVVGLPGDTISCEGGSVHRNGSAVAEPYAAGPATSCDTVTVPDGKLYLLGDNRSVAVDSRRSGPADAAGVEGRIVAL